MPEALIVINDAAGPPISFFVGAISIPTYMVGQGEGDALFQWISATTAPMTTIKAGLGEQENNGWQDIVAGKSSRGPNGDATSLKPDIVAPGLHIVSADTYLNNASGFQVDSGSSMAAPHVTGAAALLKQLNPTFTPAQLKSALMSTSEQISNSEWQSATPFEQGAGRLNVGALADVRLTFAEPSHAQPVCLRVCSFTNTVTNVSNSASTWFATPVGAGALAITVSPSRFELAPGQSAEYSVTINASAVASGEWHFGDLTFTDTSPNTEHQHVPFAIYALTSEPAIFEKTVDGPAIPLVGDMLTYTLRLRNPATMAQTFTITDTLPATLSLDLDSVMPGFGFNSATGELFGDVTIDPAVTLTSSAAPTYLTLAGRVEPLNCTGLCDDDWFEIDTISFIYMGETVERIYINTNGFISLEPPTGDVDIPQNLPRVDQPNGVIAPLWSDFDLAGDATDTAGGGSIYTGLVTTAGNPSGWTVIEWHNAQHWMDPLVKYTFQLWIENEGDGLRFTYGDLTGFERGRPAAVGVEDVYGIVGANSYYRDGVNPATGAAPSTTTDVEAHHDTGATITYVVTATATGNATNVAEAVSDSAHYFATHRSYVYKQNLYMPLLSNQN